MRPIGMIAAHLVLVGSACVPSFQQSMATQQAKNDVAVIEHNQDILRRNYKEMRREVELRRSKVNTLLSGLSDNARLDPMYAVLDKRQRSLAEDFTDVTERYQHLMQAGGTAESPSTDEAQEFDRVSKNVIRDMKGLARKYFDLEVDLTELGRQHK